MVIDLAVSLAALWLLARALLAAGTELPWYVLYLAGAAAFLLYDWVYSLLITIYLNRIARFFS